MRAVRGNLGGFVLLPGQASGKFPMWLINANPKSAKEGAANYSDFGFGTLDLNRARLKFDEIKARQGGDGLPLSKFLFR